MKIRLTVDNYVQVIFFTREIWEQKFDTREEAEKIFNEFSRYYSIFHRAMTDRGND